MQEIVKERTRVMGPCTNLHPGDVAHRIYSGLRKDDLDDVVPVFEDEIGILGFGIVWPKDGSFDVVTRIGVSDEERSMIVEQIAERATRQGRVATDVIGEDTSFISELSALGFRSKSGEYVFAQSHLEAPVSVPHHDFVVRSVTTDDVEQLAAVHGGAFGSRWTPDEYAARMRQPGYSANDELVAVEPDGTFMGFTVMWYDTVNMVGYFEPVGVHRDFHRRGVGSVLLREGMSRMQLAGMETATVWHSKVEERAVRFYRKNGFVGKTIVTGWERTAFDGSISVIR